MGLALAGATLILLSPGRADAATTIAFSGFEASGDTWTGASLSGTGGSFNTATGSGDFPPSQRILDGLRSFQTTVGAATVDFDPVDVSGFDSIVLTLRVTSTSGTSGNGNDTPDTVQMFVALNGSAFSLTPDITLAGNSNARWGYNATLVGSTTAGVPISLQAPQGGTNTNNYSTFTISILDSATSVDFRIVSTNDTANEFWNVDSVSLTGIAVPEPSALAALFGGFGALGGFCRLRRSSPRLG